MISHQTPNSCPLLNRWNRWLDEVADNERGGVGGGVVFGARYMVWSDEPTHIPKQRAREREKKTDQSKRKRPVSSVALADRRSLIYKAITNPS